MKKDNAYTILLPAGKYRSHTCDLWSTELAKSNSLLLDTELNLEAGDLADLVITRPLTFKSARSGFDQCVASFQKK